MNNDKPSVLAAFHRESMSILDKLGSRLENFKAKSAEKKLNELKVSNINLLNDTYGGDWYYCETLGKYRDTMTTRVATVEDID